ncbi:MAG: efflux RND transporter periplasmic adaptor subunit, partial [Pseudomonadota bacterium]
SLRPGMTATADIIVAEVEDALLVPNAALRYAPPAEPTEDDQDRSGLLGMLIPDNTDSGRVVDTTTLWVLRDARAQEIEIKAGDSDGRMTEIVGGDVMEGDMIILEQINE